MHKAKVILVRHATSEFNQTWLKTPQPWNTVAFDPSLVDCFLAEAQTKIQRPHARAVGRRVAGGQALPPDKGVVPGEKSKELTRAAEIRKVQAWNHGPVDHRLLQPDEAPAQEAQLH